MLISKIIKEAIENLFQFDHHIPWNYLWCCHEKDTPTPLPPFKRSGGNAPLSGVPAYRHQQSLSCCITCQDVCVQ